MLPRDLGAMVDAYDQNRAKPGNMCGRCGETIRPQFPEHGGGWDHDLVPPAGHPCHGRGVTRQAEERRLYGRVLRWAREQGWRHGQYGWESPDGLTAVEVDVDVHGAEVLIRRRGSHRVQWPWAPRGILPARSVREGVDLLVAAGVLPVELSSAYRAGYVAALTGTPEPELEQAAREQLAGGVR